MTSADTSDAPLIDPDYFTHQADVDVAVAAFKRVRAFLIGDEYFPGHKNVMTDAQIERFVRGQFNTIWHASYTCSMEKSDNPYAVIDSQARVIVVEGLRIVDTSVFPMLTPGHPMSTVCEYPTLSI
jgi:choline dehydrogenase